MGWKDSVKAGGKIAAAIIAEKAVEAAAKGGAQAVEDLFDHQKTLIKVPNLKEVHIDEAMRILKDELHFVPTKLVAKPTVAYAKESENEVVKTEPRFGSRVDTGTTVKVFYLTQEVIEKSKALAESAPQEFSTPRVIGLNLYDARQDLESMGLRVTEKLDKPNTAFTKKEDGQVTRLTYPNDKNVGSKLKTNERVILYYVNDVIISESIAMKAKVESDRKELLNKIGKATHDVTKGLADSAKDATKNIANKFSKK